MGVHGLWRLIEPSGKPVPLESLENKVLAVDVSIWLHQIVKGFQDAKGAAVPHAHLLGIYHRVCKLLYFRIKPVFVFDGGVPVLKKQTIALRNQQKSKTLSEAERIHKNLLSALVKHSAISKVLSEKAKAAITASTSPTKRDDDELYVLPPSQSLDSTLSQSDSSDSEDSGLPRYDLHSIDTESAEFKSLPADVRHEILSDLKDTRKQSSWGRIHEMPTQSDNFSTYQMKRLLKRQSVQIALENVEKEMGGHSLSLGELEKLLKDQGVITNLKGNRIASDENTRFLLIKDIKQAMEDAKKQNLPMIEESEEGDETKEEEKNVKNKGDQEFEDDLKRAIELSLEATPSTSKIKDNEDEVPSTSSKGKRQLSLSFLTDFEDADFGYSDSSEEEEAVHTRLTPAQRYMMEYSGLTPSEIAKIIASKSRTVKSASEETKEEKDKNSAQAVESSSDVSNSIIKSPEETKDETDEAGSSSDVSNNIIRDSEQTMEEIEKYESSSNICSAVTKGSIENGVDLADEVITSTVEVMSDSTCSDEEDFVDVDEELQTKNTIGNTGMEVVIKPDEEIEDDLFKDVFEEIEEKTEVSSSTEDTVKEVEKERKTEERTSGQLLKEKIEKMVKAYTKPQHEEKKDSKANTELTVEQLNEMRDNLRKEQTELLIEKQTKERTAGNITEQMFQEAQELLELFGVPYIIAPMEAEAQCAFLELIGLTDGTITDDSDIWLFGGKTVYKNFFNQNKIVMEFKSENIQHHYKLTREQMILLAMLVGSDYTTGLTGVGPVTALEILAAFPPKNHIVSGLSEFKNWVKRGKLPGPGRTSLRGKLKNLSFTENFPNPQIVQAYLEPKVETSKERFTWGKLDVFGLVEFTRQKFGWTKNKTEEILNPILRRMKESKSQKAITDFFKVEYRVDSGGMEKQMSKRVKTALDKIGKGIGVEGEEEEPKKKKKKVGRKNEDEDIKILKETKVRSKKRVEEIQKEVKKEIQEQKEERKVNLQKLHKMEVIPQRQKDKAEMLKNRIQAIETFRRSKQGPGYVKKRAKVQKEPQKDASYLSESDTD
ncbi:DNA excision repair protein ERCC-5 homolog [Tribolium madens]|uniref:DNA excision repair protein ERCC-5 homolog n=1 Tax=Tribolium madens TaxID=41895 RepID=UPI001CF72FCA|nr:DNA excision repair protein ERCC-5 homolog [Tribolium madens]